MLNFQNIRGLNLSRSGTYRPRRITADFPGSYKRPGGLPGSRISLAEVTYLAPSLFGKMMKRAASSYQKSPKGTTSFLACQAEPVDLPRVIYFEFNNLPNS